MPDQKWRQQSKKSKWSQGSQDSLALWLRRTSASVFCHLSKRKVFLRWITVGNLLCGLDSLLTFIAQEDVSSCHLPPHFDRIQTTAHKYWKDCLDSFDDTFWLIAWYLNNDHQFFPQKIEPKCGWINILALACTHSRMTQNKSQFNK